MVVARCIIASYIILYDIIHTTTIAFYMIVEGNNSIAISYVWPTYMLLLSAPPPPPSYCLTLLYYYYYSYLLYNI